MSMKKWLAVTLLLLFIMPCAIAEGNDVFVLQDTRGKRITSYHGLCSVGDEYISGDNQHYRIVSVDVHTHTATVEHIGSASMPDVSWLDIEDSQPVAAVGQRKIALYCTHSDESYITGDGTESVEGSGGIYDIADAFAKALEKRGVTVVVSDATHLPHDAGAYRRSRATAMELLQGQPHAIFDIHRDGIPDPDEYATSVGGTDMSKVRLLVGKSNQNNEANLSFAKKIKAVGDTIYPGLIKDIYIGKGSYNQDLAPRSVLLEFGTHTLDKELVLKSTAPMSEVVYRAMYGGVTGSAGASDVSRGTEQNEPASAEEKPASDDNSGSGWMIWLIVGLAALLAILALVSTGGKGAGKSFGRSISEMTGGLLGRKRNKN